MITFKFARASKRAPHSRPILWLWLHTERSAILAHGYPLRERAVRKIHEATGRFLAEIDKQRAA